MDNITLLIVLIFVGLSIIPFVAILRAKGKKTKQLLTILRSAASSSDSNLTHYEVEGNTAVALDNKKGYFFFLNLRENNSKVDVTDLLEFQKCNCVKEYHNNADQNIHLIALEFVPLYASRAIKRLVFFDSSVNYQPSGELHFAEKWSRILQGLIDGAEPIETKLDHKVVELID
jgi:hypothetical protein